MLGVKANRELRKVSLRERVSGDQCIYNGVCENGCKGENCWGLASFEDREVTWPVS